MKIIVEVQKTDKPPRRPYILAHLSAAPIMDSKEMVNEPFLYDATKQENLIIEDKFIKRDQRNVLSIFTYKSEKEHRRYVKSDGTGRTVYNVIMIILTVILLVVSFGLFISFIGKKAEPALRFYCPVQYDYKDLHISIHKRKMSWELVSRTPEEKSPFLP